VIAAAAVALAVALAAALLLARDDAAQVDDLSAARLVTEDPFAFEQNDPDDLLVRGRDGLAHVLYELSPGGVERTAERVARLRSEIEAAAEREEVDPETLAAVIFLESAGRADVIAGPDPESAAGLAQILPGTAADLLGMSVDLERSKRLTAQIAKGERRLRKASKRRARRAAERRRTRLLERRRAVDDRFDPRAALEGAARYLRIAEERFGREDLAVTSYHMGIGNLEDVIATYLSPEPVAATTRETVGENDLSYVQLYFDSSPVRNPATHAKLTALGDDSRNYLFKVEAAREIIRLHRDEPEELARFVELHARKGSGEEVLRPPDATEAYPDPGALAAAYDDGELVPLPDDAPRLGYRIEPGMGELAAELDQEPALYRGLRPEALATLAYLAGQVRAIAGKGATLTVTSTVRDGEYQRLLTDRNPEATANYSLHVTGYAFDVERDLGKRRERALVFALDRLRALGVVDWVYEPAAFHVTVGPRAEELLDAL
jgi:soluble lytic murein transglycosylase-like protein